MLTIEKTIENGKAVVKPVGRLDTVTAPELEREIQAIIPDLSELVFDFADLEYISSAGLRVLLAAQKAMKAKGEMIVRNVNDTVLEIFEVTGFSDILTIQ